MSKALSSSNANSFDRVHQWTMSVVVILLRRMIRENVESVEKAFQECEAVDTILQWILEDRLNPQSLALLLHLISCITKCSGMVLATFVRSGAVRLLLEKIKEPLSCSSKFIVLLLNRWSFDEDAFHALQSCNAADIMLNVLVTATPSGGGSQSTDPELLAYIASTISFLCYRDPSILRSRLLEDRDVLRAFSCAICCYKRCFKRGGFVDAILVMVLHGAEGVSLLAQLVKSRLIPLWIDPISYITHDDREEGRLTIARFSDRDVIDALERLCRNQQDMLSTVVAVSHLLRHSKAFIPVILSSGRLEALVDEALKEIWLQDHDCGCGLSCGSEDDGDAALHGSANEERSSVLQGRVLEVGSSAKRSENDASRSRHRHRHHLNDWRTSPLPRRILEKSESDLLDAIESPRSLINFFQNSEMTSIPSNPSGSRRESLSNESTSSDAHGLTSRTSNGSSNTIAAQLSNRVHDSAAENNETYPMLSSRDLVYDTLGHHSDFCCRCRCRAAISRLISFAPLARNLLSSGSDVFSSASGTPPKYPVFPREDINIPRYDTLKFIVGGKTFHAVGFVLEAHSPFLRGLLGTVQGVNEDIVVPSVGNLSDDEMQQLFLKTVEWCYTGELVNCSDRGEDPAEILRLWTFAEFLQIDGLQRYCETLLESHVDGNPVVMKQCLAIADDYPSGRCLRRLIAKCMLQLIVDDRIYSDEEMDIIRSFSVPRQDQFVADIANELRIGLLEVTR